MTHKYDMIIIGSGPAGMTAGIYSGRATLKTAIFQQQLGGQMSSTWDIENYPGTGGSITGPELTDDMKKQCLDNKVEFITEGAKKITRESEREYRIDTDSGNTYYTPVIVVATGSNPRMLNVPGEEKYRGLGVSYCATCDAPFFKDLTVAVVGGGDSALEEAIYLSRFASKIYLIHRRDQFRASKILVDRVKKIDSIEIIYDTVVKEIKGGSDGLVNGIEIENVKTKERSELALEGVFIFAGHIPNTSFLRDSDLFTLNMAGYVKTDETMNAGKPGLYAAGDVREKPIRQIVTAASDGAIAGIKGSEYAEEFDLLS